jgi:hypothetical protein
VVDYASGAINYTETLSFHIDNAANNPANKILWKTDQVTLSADDFYIRINGKKYLANVANVAVSSDPGTPVYTTLELIWNENGVEMRMFVYFKSDASNWWSDEIRTYDGQNPGNWIFYKNAKFFMTPLGDDYTVSGLDIQNDPTEMNSGLIHFSNLTISTHFTQPSVTVGPSVTPTICATREHGDANCDGNVNFIDYEIWRSENIGETQGTDANFNYKDGDTKVDFIDFEIWRQGFLSEVPPVTISCAQPVDCAAPPEGCTYQDGNSCSCGTLVCANVTDTLTPTVSITPVEPLSPTVTAIPTP